MKYKDKTHAVLAAQANRMDPIKMMENLKLQGIDFVQTQMRTLIFEDPARLEGLLRTSPEFGTVFICLTRDQIQASLLK